MTKMAANWLKSIPNWLPKRLKNHTLWSRTYLYSPCKGAPPWDHHPGLSCISMIKVKKCKFLPSTSFLWYCLYTLKWNITHLTSLSSGADVKSHLQSSFGVVTHCSLPQRRLSTPRKHSFLFFSQWQLWSYISKLPQNLIATQWKLHLATSVRFWIWNLHRFDKTKTIISK